jgi:DNA-binding transcriptional MerR regulator
MMPEAVKAEKCPDFDRVDPPRAMDNAAPDREMSIGELCEVFDLTPRTLRFWEAQGLISATRHGNRRYYSPLMIDRLKQILKLKSLEFTLVEIRRLIAVSGDGTSCELQLTRDVIEFQLDHLLKLKRRFERAIDDLSRLARVG